MNSVATDVIRMCVIISSKSVTMLGRGAYSCTRHKGVWRCGGVAPFILNIDTR